MKVMAPGGWIGILGAGQLAQMTILAAARLGYRCHVFAPDADAPALSVCAKHTRAAFDDVGALEPFAKSVGVVTLEWENVPTVALDVLARHVDVFPGASVLRVAQDRRLEKNFARDCGVGTAPFAVIESEWDLVEALRGKDRPSILKTARMGYDGKGQVRLAPGDDAAAAWAAVGGVPCVLEDFVAFEAEISVIVARRADGAVQAFPPVRNRHENGILAETTYPAGVAVDVEAEAVRMALCLADKLDVVGLLAVEMFVLATPDAQGRRVLMNEIAPRPHNSGHWTMDACACGQFEQLVRAVCGLPLGDPQPHSAAVMHNLLGDAAQAWPDYLAAPGACLHLYGKTESRAGRKMGHVTMVERLR